MLKAYKEIVALVEKSRGIEIQGLITQGFTISYSYPLWTVTFRGVTSSRKSLDVAINLATKIRNEDLKNPWGKEIITIRNVRWSFWAKEGDLPLVDLVIIDDKWGPSTLPDREVLSRISKGVFPFYPLPPTWGTEIQLEFISDYEEEFIETLYD